MKRIFLAVMLLLALVLPASATANHNGVYQGLILYERYDRTGDTRIMCNATINSGHCAHMGNLQTVPHTQAGYCEGNGGVNGDNWDNCVSHVSFFLPPGQCLVLYNGYWYTNTIVTLFSNNIGVWQSYGFGGVGGGLSEHLSSYRFGTEVDGGTGPHCYFPS